MKKNRKYCHGTATARHKFHLNVKEKFVALFWKGPNWPEEPVSRFLKKVLGKEPIGPKSQSAVFLSFLKP